jgi:hypothetical protein
MGKGLLTILVAWLYKEKYSVKKKDITAFYSHGEMV